MPPLKRKINQMPQEVRLLLLEENLMENFLARPPYQQNDYLGWINRAKRVATKQKRINQMLEELELGNIYMKMSWSNSKNQHI